MVSLTITNCLVFLRVHDHGILAVPLVCLFDVILIIFARVFYNFSIFLKFSYGTLYRDNLAVRLFKYVSCMCIYVCE